jgi:pulcherriminic acid synthase
MTISRPAPPDILSPEHARDPYETYRILLEDYPVLYHPGTQSWIVSRHEDVSELFHNKLVTSDNYAWQLEPVHGRTILQMEGREHTAHRRLLTPFFHGTGLDRFRPTIARTAQSLAEPFLQREAAAVRAGERDRGEADIAYEFTRMYPISVIVEMLDLPQDEHEKFERWYVSIMEFLTNLDGAPGPIEAGLRTRRELADYLLPVIAERREGDGDDLISLFCRAEVDGEKLTDDDIRGFISLTLTAGGETTDRAISSLFSNLLQNPEQLAAVYEDHTLIDDAFAETLRHSPMVHMVMRQATEDLELQGVSIPAGATITCMLGAANRDPRKFADPDRFDIFRTDNDTERAFRASADHVTFADGRHFCVGAMLARTEVQVGVGLLLDHMKDLRLRDGVIPVEEGVYTRAPNHVEVTFVPA